MMAAASAFAIQGTLMTETETLTGEIKWQGRNKQYVISVKKGSTLVSATTDLSSLDDGSKGLKKIKIPATGVLLS